MVVRSVSFAPPHTPPTTREDDLSVLRLIRSRRVGPATFHRLIADHGSAAAALAALPDIAAAAGIEGYAPCPEGVAAAEITAGRRLGAELITLADPRYPPLLREIPDAPPALWVQGEVSALARPLIAVVGARNASSLGLRMARGLALALSEAGIGVTAGLARGVDTAAHEASCAAGTIAVLAGGIDRIYPAENRALAERIRAAGCLVTEQPPGLEPVARHFPTRNRIVSGLCTGVVVVEAAHRSGTLITARCAAEQGREVMAVPGHPLDARAGGCNALIRDGATLVRSAADVLAAVGIEAGAVGGGVGDGAGVEVGAGEGRDAEARSRKGGVGEGLSREGGAGAARSRSSRPSFRAVESAEATPPSAVLPPTARGARVKDDTTKRDRPASGGTYGKPSAVDRDATAPGATADGPQSHRRSAPPSFNTAYPSAARGGPREIGEDSETTLKERLINLLGPSPTDEDSLIRLLSVPAARLAPLLLELELDGRLVRMPGSRVALLD
ncbi:DNA protecting protein DprA [Paracoccus sanguinis]|uniref:DNA protecting protein DprA n=1 Tax=Paracoccus sanguinis TaxID=1545044 RepID=A0A1H2SAT7_9RHOB|nr:DNA protecting protein DprA [Paracoccus sanguinis]